MLNKLLIAGVAGAALVAIGTSTANAQFAVDDCANFETVTLISQAGSCRVYFVDPNGEGERVPSDKVLSDLSFSDNIPDGTAFTVDVEFVPTGDTFNVRLGGITGAANQTFDYAYTISIDDPTNRFKFVGLTQNAGSQAPDITSTKTFQAFDGDGNQVDLSGNPSTDDIVLTVSGTDTANTGDFAGDIKTITVQDQIVAAANAIFNSLTNEFQQARVTIEVPVPASLALFGFGLVAMGYRLRRKA